MVNRYAWLRKLGTSVLKEYCIGKNNLEFISSFSSTHLNFEMNGLALRQVFRSSLRDESPQVVCKHGQPTMPPVFTTSLTSKLSTLRWLSPVLPKPLAEVLADWVCRAVLIWSLVSIPPIKKTIKWKGAFRKSEYVSKHDQLQYIRISVDRFHKWTLSLDRFLKFAFVPNRFFIWGIGMMSFTLLTLCLINESSSQEFEKSFQKCNLKDTSSTKSITFYCALIATISTNALLSKSTAGYRHKRFTTFCISEP